MYKRKMFSIVLVIATITFTPIKTNAKLLPATTPEKVGMSTSVLTTVDEVINTAIADKRTPGAVLLVGHKGYVVYKKAYGDKMIQPHIEKMTPDTIFDMASLTKPTATATGIMILAEEGLLDVNDKVSKYIPEFAQKGKEDVTIVNLMTHTAGLKPDVADPSKDNGYDGVIQEICSLSTSYTPGTKFIYSDLGFITLGEIIRRVSGRPENEFVSMRVFKPLGMTDTGYLPPKNKLDRCAPTAYRNGKLMQGQVNDPTAWAMGGVAGHAGLFSTVDDMAILCQMLLNGGEYNGMHILKPESVRLMTTNQSQVTTQPRGLGWDVGSSFAGQRGKVFPKEGFGHTGWTGTSVWVDPGSQTFVIVLTNSRHPNNGGNVLRMRARVADIVATSITKD